jgi:Ni,Fe-hydrogenase III large subunit
LSNLEEFASARPIQDHRPWPRAIVDADVWSHATSQLAEGRWDLIALWGEPDTVHLAARDPAQNEMAVFTFECANGEYPSVAQFHPPAIRLERALHDLLGLKPIGLPDLRPWIDHGRWGVKYPLSSRQPGDTTAGPYAFMPAAGESLHQVAVGPVHAGIIEPGFFQFTANGETVVRLEERLGYVHKGIEHLMRGADLDRAIKLAGRTSGDSTVSYAYAFARAAEAALGVEVPLRAVWLRALLAELERIANHLGDVGAICNDAAFAIMHVQCGILRERVLRAADICLGHRLMRDCVVVGGVSHDLGEANALDLSRLMTDIEKHLPRLSELYDKTASLQDRTVGTGILKPELARQYACGGFVGRGSGRTFDARKAFAYPPYDELVFEVPVLDEGDVNARVWIRIREIEQSLSLVRQLLSRLPQGPVRAEKAPNHGGGEGLAMVEGFRGDIFAWVRVSADGRIDRCHLRDPSWFQWPLLEAAIEGNIVADFPLCNKSFNCSYSGHDL